MKPTEIGIRRKITLDPSIVSNARQITPLVNNCCEWERVLKIGDKILAGEDCPLSFREGNGCNPCMGTIMNYYPFTEMQRVILDKDGTEIYVEGVDPEFTENTSTTSPWRDVMVRCPKVYFKDELTVEETDVWGYEYHWVCKYKADEGYYVDPFHVRNDGQIFNGYCYISCFASTISSNIAYSLDRENGTSYASVQDWYVRINTNKNNAVTSGKNTYWSIWNVNALRGYISKLWDILYASSSSGSIGGGRLRDLEYSDNYHKNWKDIPLNSFGVKNGVWCRYDKSGATCYGSLYRTGVCQWVNNSSFLGLVVVNNALYFQNDYKNNYTTVASDITGTGSTWKNIPYFTMTNSAVRSHNYDSTYRWLQWASNAGEDSLNYGLTYTNHGTAANVVYFGQTYPASVHDDIYIRNSTDNNSYRVMMVCYPDSLNGAGAPTGEDNVVVSSVSPSAGTTIAASATVTYTFSNSSAKPAMFDMSNNNMLILTSHDGVFTFGSQYEGSVTWTDSTKQVSVRRKQGWLTGSCNIWVQAADDQT